MRLITSCIFFVLFTGSVGGQSIPSVEATTAFIKVWGFLKYYHPTVCSGSLNFVIPMKDPSAGMAKSASKQKLKQFGMNNI